MTFASRIPLALAAGAALVFAGAAFAAAPVEHAERATTTLYANVGNSFAITLKTKAGKPVKSLKAGTYSIVVNDASDVHNFRLKGPGFNKATSVSGKVANQKWTLKATKGTYTFVCDPHASSMKGSFTVS